MLPRKFILKHTKHFQLYLTILFLFNSTFLTAQIKPDTAKNVQYLLLPTIFKTPETGWAFGATASLSFKATYRSDTLTRTSNIQSLVFFTSRKQNIQVIDATFYSPKENYILLAQISHSYFPDKFWGVGPNTKDNYIEPYVFEQLFISPHLKRRITKRLFAGLLYQYQNILKLNYQAGGTFDTMQFSGKGKYHVSGIGISTSFDSRNYSFWPTKGIFIETVFTNFDKGIGSDYNSIKWTLDFRYFKKILTNQVLAFQLYNYITAGNPPIRELASMGGAGNLRGIYQGRFRDNCMTTFIAEWRIPIIWRLSACTFGGVGNVYKQFSDWQHSDLKYSFGGGLRLALLEKEKLNLRIDYGYYTKYNKGLYVTVGESF